MMGRSLAIFALSLCWSVAGTATALADYQTLPVPFTGEWTGGAFSNAQTHRFDYCFASVRYRSGITLAVAIGRAYDWRLVFADQSWNLNAGSQFPLVVSFDNGAPWTLTGRVVNRGMIRIDMPGNSALIDTFRNAYTMRVYVLGHTLGFNLTNTSELLPELAECVRSELALEAAGGSQPAPPAPPAPSAPPAPPAPSAGPPPAAAPAPAPAPAENPAAGNAELQLAATRIASNLLLAAKLPNARLLSRAETPTSLQGRGVAWTSDTGSGAVELLPPSVAQDPQGVASALISSAATACKGEFASGRSTDVVDEHMLATAFTECKDAGAATAVRYFIVRAANSAFVVFALVGGASGEAPPGQSAISDAAFRSAAVAAAYSPSASFNPAPHSEIPTPHTEMKLPSR